MVDDDDIEAFLEHYGVKGMHWGVVKKEETSGDSSVQKALKANPAKKMTPAEKAHHAKMQAAHDSHFDKSEEESPKGWRPTKKQVALIGIGAVATAAIVGGTVYKIKTGKKVSDLTEGFSEGDYLKHIRSADTPSWIPQWSGAHISPNEYQGLVANSTGRIWKPEGFLTKEAFHQPEVKYAPGHKFFRLSRAAESSFGNATYSVDSEADFARYLSTHSAGSAKAGHMINFNAKDEVRIPGMKKTLDILHSSMARHGRTNITPKDVIDEYDNMTGGGWTSKGAKNFANELKRNGYHGIVDQMDAGSYGERPLVLFDKDGFTSKIATPLKNLNLKHFEDVLTDIPNRL